MPLRGYYVSPRVVGGKKCVYRVVSMPTGETITEYRDSESAHRHASGLNIATRAVSESEPLMCCSAMEADGTCREHLGCRFGVRQ